MITNANKQKLARELAEKFMENELMLHDEISPGAPFPYKIDHFMGPAMEFVEKVVQAFQDEET